MMTPIKDFYMDLTNRTTEKLAYLIEILKEYSCVTNITYEVGKFAPKCSMGSFLDLITHLRLSLHPI